MICDNCNGEGYVGRSCLNCNNWDGFPDDTRYSCPDCVFCKYCNENIMYQGTMAFCRKCYVEYSKDDIDLITIFNKDFENNDNMFCVYIDNLSETSVIKGLINGKFYEIVASSYPKHPNELNSFIEKIIKTQILL